jgi:hypothetical protein
MMAPAVPPHEQVFPLPTPPWGHSVSSAGVHCSPGSTQVAVVSIEYYGASTVQASPGLVRVIPMVAHASTCMAAQLCATVYSLERREVSGGVVHFLFCGPPPRGAAEQPSSDRRVNSPIFAPGIFSFALALMYANSSRDVVSR